MHTLAIAAVLVSLNGQPVKDAEVCGFKARAADTPFHQLLASSDVVCNAPFAPGLWNVFARRGKELISARTVLVDTKDKQPDVELRLEPAAIVAFANVPERAHGAVYVTDTVSAFPAGAAGEALVPANRELLPLLARDAAPIAVGEGFELEPHTRKAVTLDPATTHAAATWLSIAPADAEALRATRRKQPPQIKAGSKPAANPLRGTIVMNGAMQFIRDVPKGNATLELIGVPWKRQTATVVVPASGVAVTAAPMMLVPTSSAIVKWLARRNLNELVASIGTPCKPPKHPAAAKPVVSLMTCRGAQTARSLPFLDRDLCKVIGEHEWAVREGSGDIAFENLDAGAYVVEFSFSALPPFRQLLHLDRFEQQNVLLDVDYTTLYGRVTAGGERLSSPARLDFKFGYEAFSDADGNYTVVMPKTLTAGSVISVRTCDGSLSGEEIVDQDVLPNSHFDVDLSKNTITVEAVDSDTGKPVAGALVRYGAFRTGEMSSVYYFRLAYDPDAEHPTPDRTDEQGHYTIRSLPPDKTLRVCLEHEDYDRTCADPTKLTSTEDKTLRIAMEPKGSFGQIAGVSNVVGGQIYWFSADGNETERATVKSDGSFRFDREHQPGEAVVFVSANHPLFAFAQPAGDSMVVTMPAATSRTFTVSIGDGTAQQDALVTIAIGSLVVPYPPLAQHLALHGSQLELRNRGPLLIPDILETGAITAILGPPPAEITPQMHAIDLFRLPQFRGLPRKPVIGDRVVF
jgi:hypothetical protein